MCEFYLICSKQQIFPHICKQQLETLKSLKIYSLALEHCIYVNRPCLNKYNDNYGALIGAAIPINSEGVLPLSYIHYNKGFAAESIFANCRQLLEQVRVKRERRARHSLPLMFFPFPKLPLSEQARACPSSIVSVSSLLYSVATCS